MRTIARTERAQTRDALEALMWEAWSKRDSREVWKIARRLAGKTRALNEVFASSTPYHPNPNFWRHTRNQAAMEAFLAEQIDWKTFCEDRIGFYQEDAPIVAPPPAVTTAEIQIFTAQPPDPPEE